MYLSTSSLDLNRNPQLVGRFLADNSGDHVFRTLDKFRAENNLTDLKIACESILIYAPRLSPENMVNAKPYFQFMLSLEQFDFKATFDRLAENLKVGEVYSGSFASFAEPTITHAFMALSAGLIMQNLVLGSDFLRKSAEEFIIKMKDSHWLNPSSWVQEQAAQQAGSQLQNIKFLNLEELSRLLSADNLHSVNLHEFRVEVRRGPIDGGSSLGRETVDFFVREAQKVALQEGCSSVFVPELLAADLYNESGTVGYFTFK